MPEKKKANMYSDSVKQWNCFVGCFYDCVYCEKSFKAQMKRQKHNCIECYNYEPHFHENRLNDKLPRTYGDEFIWCCSSSDIHFAEKEWIEKILDRIYEMPERTFFFQTKDPDIFNNFRFPENVLLGVTIETNRYYPISSAPHPYLRMTAFERVQHPRKVITIEPILDFDHDELLTWVSYITPERVYIGYDTKKCHLPEPPMSKTRKLINEMKKITTVKTKYLKEEVK